MKGQKLFESRNKKIFKELTKRKFEVGKNSDERSKSFKGRKIKL